MNGLDLPGLPRRYHLERLLGRGGEKCVYLAMDGTLNRPVAISAVVVKPGDSVLAWAFAHAVKEWRHSIGYSLGGGQIKILEERSEAKKDPDHSVGFALVRS